MDAIKDLRAVNIVVHRCLEATEVHTDISCAINEEKINQKNKNQSNLSIYLYIYIFLYIVFVSVEQYMQ